MTDAAALDDPSARLEAAFLAIEAKMRGLAFVNPALRVEAVAFAPWKSYWLGVMVTPWSMNILLLPRQPGAWRPLAVGEKRRYAFPAGSYDFVSARDAAIGDYLACSLFSPVLEFADHEMACMTAALARAALFDATHAETLERRDGDAERGALAELAAAIETPLSRRDLLRGRLRGRER